MMVDTGCTIDSRLLLCELIVRPSVVKYLQRLCDEKYATFKHSMNVAYLVAEIIHNKGVTENVEDIICGALLHDIGKLAIPDEILLKKGKLTDEEWDLMRQHPVLGYEMIKDEEDISDLTKQIVLKHHEKLDGSGYPTQAEDLNYEIQIVTVCDIYDALTEPRTYGKMYNLAEAFGIISTEPVNTSVLEFIRRCPDK